MSFHQDDVHTPQSSPQCCSPLLVVLVIGCINCLGERLTTLCIQNFLHFKEKESINVTDQHYFCGHQLVPELPHHRGVLAPQAEQRNNKRLTKVHICSKGLSLVHETTICNVAYHAIVHCKALILELIIKILIQNTSNNQAAFTLHYVLS